MNFHAVKKTIYFSVFLCGILMPAAAQEKSLVIFSLDTLAGQLISPTSKPQQSRIVTELKIFAAGGEKESVTFAIHALKELENVKVQCKALRTKDETHEIAISNIRIENVAFLKKRYPTTHSATYTVVPAYLDELLDENVSEGRNQVYCITVTIPDTQPPGIYEGSVEITTEGKEIENLKLMVRVLPFLLEDSGITSQLCHFANDARAVHQGDHIGYVQKYFEMLKDYGIESLFYPYMLPRISWSEKGSVSERKTWEISSIDFDKRAIDYSPYTANEVLKAIRDSKLRGPFCGFDFGLLMDYTVPINSLNDPLLAQKVKAFKLIAKSFFDHAAELKVPPFIMIIGDEPWGQGRFKGIEEVYPFRLKLWKEVAPAGTKTTALFNNGWTGPLEYPYCLPYLDINTSNFMNEHVVEGTKKTGIELWSYNGGSAGKGVPKPLLDRFAYGFWLCRIGATGVTQFTASFMSGDKQDAFNDLDGNESDYVYIYPDHKKPLASLALQGIREGIDDARYFFHLHRLLSKAAQKLDSANELQAKLLSEEIGRGKQTLSECMDFPLDFQNSNRDGFIKNELEKMDLNIMRWKIAMKIISIRKLLDQEEK